MGIIEDLRSEARVGEQSRAAEQQVWEARREANMRSVGPKMRALHDFFRDFVNTLQATAPEIRVDYDVPGFGTLHDLVQCEYEIEAAEPTRRFGFYCNCIVPDISSVPELDNEVRAREKPSWAGDFIRFRTQAHGSEGGVVRVEAFVPVSLKFKADADEKLIRLTIKNLEYIGKSTYSFEPEAIRPALMEELAKSVLRRPNDFHELSGDRVATEFRLRLQHDIAAQRREQQQTEEEVGLLKRALGFLGGGG